MITTNYGNIIGVSEENYTIYKGVPFAKPPVGILRFQPPQKLVPWEGIYQADSFPNACMQTPLSKDDFFEKEFGSAEKQTYDEDSLYLNIWIPKDTKIGDDLPVAVWLYGGELVSGYSAEKEYDGKEYTKRGVATMVAWISRLDYAG